MQFQTQQLDPESELYYMRARMYDPEIGRFLSRDPVEGHLTIPQSQNPYAYGLNNPVVYSDPSGKQIPPPQTLIQVGQQVAQFCARSAVAGVNLAKSLASQQQMGETGKIIAGGKSETIFRDAAEAAQQYGGQAADWVKKVSAPFTAPDGTEFETHWVENLATGVRTLFKTKFIE